MSPAEKKFLFDYMEQQALAVLATSSVLGLPQAAVLGVAITEELDFIFDTVKRSRKYKNLLENPRVAIVIGWDNETTVQCEGRAQLLDPNTDKELIEIYYRKYPDGRNRATEWEGLVHFVLKPTWIRYSNFNEPRQINEYRFGDGNC